VYPSQGAHHNSNVKLSDAEETIGNLVEIDLLDPFTIYTSVMFN